MSAQKALQGSETERRELLGGMEENSVSPIDFLPIWLPNTVDDYLDGFFRRRQNVR